MLDVIADFWKPVKKIQPQEKLQEAQLQIGSAIGFGFVPQSLLSGRRLTVSAINTYQFGTETLTSYLLSQDREPSVSMIVAEADEEQYLAISRRIPLEERSRLFDSADLDRILAHPDTTRLACKDNIPEFKGWLVSSYKREINGMKGRIYKGDHRRIPLPATSEGQDFHYTLLVSDSNEHALEMEKYGDGRMEIYATIYRRINDVGEISHPISEMVSRPEIKLATKRDDTLPATPAAALLEPVVVPKPAEVKAATASGPEFRTETPALKTPEKVAEKISENTPAKTSQGSAKIEASSQPSVMPVASGAAKPSSASSISVQKAEPAAQPGTPTKKPQEAQAVNGNGTPVEQLTHKIPYSPVATAPKAEAKPAGPLTTGASKAETATEPKKVEPKVEAKTETIPQASAPAAPAANTKPEIVTRTVSAINIHKEKSPMSNNEAPAVNGASNESARPTLYVHGNGQEHAQSVRAVSRQHNALDNDSIECDLRVANKLIDEAIRNEMRLNDVVRRVIELPVANPESVQIPVTLTDEDFSLLAIRYGIPANDRNAIKRRIIEDLNDFSGEAKA